MKAIFKFSLIFVLIGLTQCQTALPCLIPDYTPSTDCCGFFRCTDGMYSFHMCPSGLLFDINIVNCNWAKDVNCKNPTNSLSAITMEKTTTSFITPNAAAFPNNQVVQTNTEQGKSNVIQILEELFKELKNINTPNKKA